MDLVEDAIFFVDEEAGASVATVMIAILHKARLMVILPMLLPLIRLVFKNIPKLAEDTSVNSPKEYYYFNFASDIQIQ